MGKRLPLESTHTLLSSQFIGSFESRVATVGPEGCVTVTEAVAEALLLAALTHETAYCVVADGVTVAEPLVLLLVEKPVPEHAMASAELQLMVELCPAVTVEGVASKVTVGADCDTATAALADALALAELVHDTEYCVVAEGLTVTEPLVLLLVEKPLPVHTVAFVELQVRVELCPAVMDSGETFKDTIGVGGGVVPEGVTATVVFAEALLFDEALFVQITEYAVVAEG